MKTVGMEDAIKYRKLHVEGWEAMLNDEESSVLITKEACAYLRISRPTYQKYLVMGRIRGIKAGKGWKVLKSELDRFLQGDKVLSLSETPSRGDSLDDLVEMNS